VVLHAEERLPKDDLLDGVRYHWYRVRVFNSL
jgi:hypothetical protein